MKRRILSLLLALVLLVSVIPMTAMAASKPVVQGYSSSKTDSTSKVTTYTFPDKSTIVVDKDGKVISITTALNIKPGDIVTIGKSKAELDAAKEEAHEHEYHWITTRGGHMYICDCDDHIGFVRHDDPTVLGTGYCYCGYKYYDDADLNVLWFTDIRLDTKFDPDKTEYTGKTVAWKEVTETKLTARAHDVRATLELPEDLTVKKGTNVFTIKITAEDGVTTKTYTFTIENP